MGDCGIRAYKDVEAPRPCQYAPGAVQGGYAQSCIGDG